jgi:carbamoyltransferase
MQFYAMEEAHMIILGISAFYHDSAVCILRDGEILFAAQEERYTRIKHDRNFPINAIAEGLKFTGLTIRDIDYVSYYDKPLLTFERLFETWLSYAPVGLRSFMTALPVWLNEKLFLSREIDKGLGNEYPGPLHYMRHHQSHAASAFYPSPFQEAAVLTIDGVGEWSTTTIGVDQDHQLKLLKEIRFPHSLGLLYSAFTYYLGFRVNSGEYKVMGLAPYGKPVYADLIHKHLIDLKSDGSFWLDMKYFNYCQGLTMTSGAFHELFGGAPRRSESDLTQREMDLAASVQKVCEDVMLALARQAKLATGMEYLTMAGGCALNCVANGLISREKIFKKIFVQPAAGDAGGSLGAALMTWHEVLDNKRVALPSDSQKGSYLGQSYKFSDVEAYLRSIKALYLPYDQSTLPNAVADLLAEGRVVGFFHGRMEFGPRALGSRSIIGDPRRPDMQAKMNLKIKFRESFRPFAPVVLKEKCSDYFDLEEESPYMLMVAPVNEQHRDKEALNLSKGKNGIELLNVKRSDIPAVTHVDFSARVQTLTEDRNGMLYHVTKAFHEKTGCPVLINTSFNIRGEPIVNTPQDAYRCFMYTDMDALVLEDCILLKEQQTPMAGADTYKAQFIKKD